MKLQTYALPALLGTTWFLITSILRYFHPLARLIYSQSLLSELVILADLFYALVLILFFYHIYIEKKFVKLKLKTLLVIISLIVYFLISLLNKIPSLWQHTDIFIKYPFLKFSNLLIVTFLFFFWKGFSTLKLKPEMRLITLFSIYASIWYLISILVQLTERIWNLLILESLKNLLLLSKPVFLVLQCLFFAIFLFAYSKGRTRKKNKRGSK